MSIGRGSGKVRRSGILAAAVVAALMLAVPLSVPTSDAELGELYSGYVYTVSDGATEAELDAFDHSTEFLLKEAVSRAAPVFSYFDGDIADTENASLGTSYGCTDGSASSMSDGWREGHYIKEREFVGFTLTLLFTQESKLTSLLLQSKLSQAANAIVSYFGTDYLSPGDRLTFSGDYSYRSIMALSEKYSCVSGDSYVETRSKEYYVYQTVFDVKATYTPVSGEERSVTFTCDGRDKVFFDYDHDFGKDVSELAEGDPYTVSLNEEEYEYEENPSVDVGGRNYSTVYEYSTDIPDGTAVFCTSGDLMTEPWAPSYTSTEHIEFDPTYDGFMDVYDDMKEDIDPKSSKALYIGIGVGAGVLVIVAAVAVFVVIRRRKR